MPHSRALRSRVGVAALAICLAAGGCTTNAEIAAQREAQFQSLVGGTMADFMRRTGLTPTDMYTTSSGRTFVFSGPVSTIVIPGSYGVPTIAAQRQCRMLIDTVATDGKGTADTWRVTGISRGGVC